MPSTQSTPPVWWLAPDGSVPEAPPGYFPVDPATGDPNMTANDPGDAPSYPTDTGWGGTYEVAPGTSCAYSDAQMFGGMTYGARHDFLVGNTTGTFGTYANVNVYVACYCIPPGTTVRKFRAVKEWCATSSGWVDWDGTTVPSGATLFRAVVDLDDAGAGTPSLSGSWPTSLTRSGVTSDVPGGGSFTFS